MVIHVSIEKTEPLTGTTSTDGKDSVPFVGWLDLLRAIAELVGSDQCTNAPNRTTHVETTEGRP
jgi:hypothetical protein